KQPRRHQPCHCRDCRAPRRRCARERMNFPLLIRVLLWPLSVLYGGYVWVRAWLYAQGWLKQGRLQGKVISVGNLTVGGTGKTPMVVWLAEKFLAEGKRVA